MPKILPTAILCWLVAMMVSLPAHHLVYGNPEWGKSLIGATVVVGLAVVSALIAGDSPSIIPRRWPCLFLTGVWGSATLITVFVTAQREGLTWRLVLGAALLSAVAVGVLVTLGVKVQHIRRERRR